MSQSYTTAGSNARGMAAQRWRLQDPVSYATAVAKRQDARFFGKGICDELLAMIESDRVGRMVRVKNTSGGNWVAGTLLYLPTAKLTPQTTATASSSPSAGASVVITIAATFQVGQIVSVASGGNTDYAIVTAVSGGVSVTVDQLFYSHTTPTVTAEPAYEASAADADGNAMAAAWVTTAAIADGAYGWAYDMALVTGIDTSGVSAEALAYLSATAGAFTSTAPTGADQIQQVVGVCKVSHATTGEMLFFPGLHRVIKIGTSGFQGTASPSAHASSHQNGGSDEVATATPGANAIPKAGAGGALAYGWMPIGTTSNTVAAGDDSRFVTNGNSHDHAGGDGAAIPLGTAVSGQLPVANGGTAGATAAAARQNLDTNGKNLIINGGFCVAQRGLSFANPADDTYTLDRWTVLRDSDVTTLAITQMNAVTGPSDRPTGAYAALQAQYQAVGAGSARKCGVVYILEARDAQRIIGGTCSLQFKAKSAASYVINNLRAGIIAWDGTADAVTSDVVSAWNAQGSNPTLAGAPNWFFENTPANLALTTSYQTFKIENVSVDTSSAKNVAVFIWVDDTDAVANDAFYIADVQLEEGATCTHYETRPYQQELALCQRYCQSVLSDSTAVYAPVAVGIAGSTSAATCARTLPVEMRATPALTATFGEWCVHDTATIRQLTSLTLQANQTTANMVSFACGDSGAGLTQYRPYFMAAYNAASKLLLLEAEL